MKERGILFSGAMVRALLDGSKTQTRRAVKGIPLSWLDADLAPDFVALPENRACPYGQPGDRLWVRETWAEVPRVEPLTDEDLPMRLDGRILVYHADPQWEGSRQFACADGCLRWARPKRWTPSIHMPRWASRILLEITGVRVERLQAIGEADARAEGVTIEDRHAVGYCAGEFLPPSIRAYRDLWEQINGAGSWAANPWVWVVEFRRIES